MNIFVTDFDPKVAAENLDNSRVVKMVLESAQLLSTAMHINGNADAPYRITHKNHPCSIWTRENNCNFLWLVNHFYYLCKEYEYRYNKEHKCFQYYDIFKEVDTEFKLTDTMTTFPNCTTFKNIKETTKAYRTYMVEKWNNSKRHPKWTNRQPPSWLSYSQNTNTFFTSPPMELVIGESK